MMAKERSRHSRQVAAEAANDLVHVCAAKEVMPLQARALIVDMEEGVISEMLKVPY